LCYNLLILEKRVKVVKEKKRPTYLHFLLIWKDECPLPTYP